MDFSIHLIDTVVMCDSALQSANKTQSELVFKKLALVRHYDEAMESAALAQSDLSNAQIELAATNTAINALPAGKIEGDMIKRRMQLEMKIFNLTRRMEGNGVLGMIEKQYDIQLVDLQLELNSRRIDLLNERRSQLTA